MALQMGKSRPAWGRVVLVLQGLTFLVWPCFLDLAGWCWLEGSTSQVFESRSLSLPLL